MDVDRTLLPPDPEFGSHRPGLLSGWLGGKPEAYLRLVANPFLAFAFVDVWLIVLHESVVGEFAGPLMPILVVVLLAGLGLVPSFMHYHCLDCGKSGRLLRWRKHVCHKALARREAGVRRKARGPTPPVQVILWIWLTMATAIFANQFNLFDK